MCREISNFEYLMQLNTIAGRTYNDLSQYPVVSRPNVKKTLKNYTTFFPRLIDKLTVPEDGQFGFLFSQTSPGFSVGYDLCSCMFYSSPGFCVTTPLRFWI